MPEPAPYSTGRGISFTMAGQPSHLDLGADPFLLRFGDQEWLCEWHRWFGPCRLNKKTRAPCENQPGEKHRWWLVIQWWHDQGMKVVDGVGVWHEPPVVEKRYRLFKRGLIEDPAGSVVRRHYEGYERFGWGPN